MDTQKLQKSRYITSRHLLPYKLCLSSHGKITQNYVSWWTDPSGLDIKRNLNSKLEMQYHIPFNKLIEQRLAFLTIYFLLLQKPPKSFYIEGQEYHRYTSKFHIDIIKKTQNTIFTDDLREISTWDVQTTLLGKNSEHVTFLSFYV